MNNKNLLQSVVCITQRAVVIVIFSFFAFIEPIASLAQNSFIADVDTMAAKHKLGEVIVTASRVALPISQSAKQVTIISRKEIEQASMQSIQDILNYVAGVDVLQRGGHGVQADISIRGGSFDQTAILLNGINLSNPQTGHYSFNIPINPNDIERIEVLHGPSSFVYGASAFSGGINIITKKDPDHKVYAKVQAGGHSLWGVEAGGALDVGISSNQISVGYNESDGYTSNSDYQILNTLWQTRIDIDKSVVDVQLGYNEKKHGANTFYSPKFSNQYDETKAYLVSMKGETGDQLKFIPSLYWSQQHNLFQLVKGDESKIPFNHHRSDVYGSNLNLQYKWNLGTTSLGAEFRNEGVLSTVLGETLNKAEGKYTKGTDRTNISYVLEHTLMLHKFTFTAGMMANYNTSIKGNYKLYPTAGAAYRPMERIKIYASWSKAVRMPTFSDLYYNTATHAGDINLKPEESESFDLGVKFSNRYFSAHLSGYLMYGDNMIDWVRMGEKWHSLNHASVNKKGVEIGVKLDLHETFNFFYPNTYVQVGYNHLNQDGDNISEEQSSNYVLNYLRDKAIAQLFLPIYKDKLSTTWSFRWQKRMGTFDDYSGGAEVVKSSFPAFSTMDVSINYKISNNWLVNVNMNNLYSTHYFDMGSIPQAGFWLIGGVSYTLR